MRIETSGTARIRHKNTGEVFEIDADELEWDAVGGSERQMGAETEYAAWVQHPDLGELTWKLWEYPVGVENYQDQELNGHELVEDFAIDLVHEPEGDEDRDEDNVRLSVDLPFDAMKEWFYGAYEDPAQSLPHDSREGGYQWINGGPYTALEALEEEYGARYTLEDLEKVAADIEDESGGLTEWTPISDPDDFDRYEGEPDSTTDEDRALAAERVRNTADELETLVKPLINIRGDHASLDATGRPGIGHNGAPDPLEEIGLPNNFFEELLKTTRKISEAVDLTQETVANVQRAETTQALLPQAKDSNIDLGQKLADYAGAIRDNTSAVIENSHILKERSKHLTRKNVAVGLIGAMSAKLIEGALNKIGEMLLDQGLPLVAPLGSAALGYLSRISAKINELADLAMQYINMLPPNF